MTQLIDRNSSEYFEQTSLSSYDRHKYKLFYANGMHETYEWYDEVISRWLQVPSGHVTHITVIDRKKKR